MSPERSTDVHSPVRDVFVALALLVCTNGPVIYVARRILMGTGRWEDPFVRPVFVATALVAVLLVILDPLRMSGRRLSRPSPVAAAAIVSFTLLAVASSLWSLAPSLTRGRSLIYVGLAALAWVIADLDFERFRRALSVALATAIGGSVLAVMLSDSIGLDHNGDWRGLYTNRNSLAPLCAMAIIVCVPLVVAGRGRQRVLAGGAGLVAAVVMLGSGSRTAWLALAVSMAVGSTVWFASVGRQKVGRLAIYGAVAGASIGLVAVIAVVSRLWNEPTLSQRRTIWGLVWDRIGERPLHGFGWFNVWEVPEFISAHELLLRGEAHNSFFEVWLSLGLLGVIPFLLIVGLALGGSARDAWRDPGPATWTWLTLVAFLVVENLTESFVLWFSYNWVLLMAAALKSGVGLRVESGPQTPAPSEPANASAH